MAKKKNNFEYNGDKDIVLDGGFSSSLNEDIIIETFDGQKGSANSGKKKSKKQKDRVEYYNQNEREYTKTQLCEMYNPRCTASRYWARLSSSSGSWSALV